MANLLVPQKPQPLAGSVGDEGAIVAWGFKRFPKGYTYNVYWEVGTFLAPPVSPLANAYSVGLRSTQESVRSGSGIVPIMTNTNVYVEVTSVDPGGVESARSPMCFLSITNAEDTSIGIGRDESGQPKSLFVNEDGSILTAPGAPAPGASTAANQSLAIAELTKLVASSVYTSQVQTNVTTAQATATPLPATPLAGRQLVVIENLSGGDVFVGPGGTPGHRIPNNGTRALTVDDTVIINVTKPSLPDGTINVWEFA